MDQLEPSLVAHMHLSFRETPYAANRALAVLSGMMKWAEQQGYRPRGSNPIKGLERFREQKRERFLSEVELRRLGDALTAAEAKASPFAIAAIRLLMFTGARRDEILTLRWEHVDLERGLLLLPDSKTGKKPIVLNAPAAALLAGLPRITGNPHSSSANATAATLSTSRACGSGYATLPASAPFACMICGIRSPPWRLRKAALCR